MLLRPVALLALFVDAGYLGVALVVRRCLHRASRRSPDDRAERCHSGSVRAARTRPVAFEVLKPAPADGSTRARLGRARRRRTARSRHRCSCRWAPTPRSRRSTPTTCTRSARRSSCANTYHLCLRPGHERIERLGGLHRFMAWDRPILTDSGGFQVVSLGDLRVDRRGRRDLPLAPRRLDPALHARALDRRPGGARLGHRGRASTSRCRRTRRSRAEVAEATARTHRWAERCLAAHERPDQALFGIIQGGLEPDLRAESTRSPSPRCPFDGLCIGGLAGDETPDQRRAALDVVRAAAGRRPAAALPDGPRLAARPARCGRRGRRHVRLGAAGAGRPQRHAAGCPRAGSTCATRASSTTRRPVQEGCRCRALPVVLARLPGAPVPGRRAARLPARDLSQPDLHPRLHGADPGGYRCRDVPRLVRDERAVGLRRHTRTLPGCP